MAKPEKPKAPPPVPVPAEPFSGEFDRTASQGYSSLISTSPTGLVRKAPTVKRSLIGGT